MSRSAHSARYTLGVLQIINSLLPLALLVALGAALLRLRFFDQAFRKGLDRLVYWVSLPALIVGVLAGAPEVDVLSTAGPMALSLCLATVAMAALTWGFAVMTRLPGPVKGVFSQAAFRGNLAFVGLPVITLALGPSEQDPATLAKAALALAPTAALFNVLGVMVLIAAQHRLDLKLPARMAKSMATNPLLLACGLGLLIWAFGLKLPQASLTTLNLLGKPAAPLALISLGGALATYPVRQRLGVATLATIMKCAGMPVLAWLVANLLGVSKEDQLIVLIYAACPTAVSSYVLSTQLKGDAALSAATIVLSTLASAVALGVVIGTA
ncbi:MAG: AEC family transporter [Planctomycetota bacterium]